MVTPQSDAERSFPHPQGLAVKSLDDINEPELDPRLSVSSRHGDAAASDITLPGKLGAFVGHNERPGKLGDFVGHNEGHLGNSEKPREDERLYVRIHRTEA